MVKRIVDVLKNGTILICDGAWGTFLHNKGLGNQCPEAWNMERSEDVTDIARAYAEAGADIIKTNTFGGNRFKLANYGLEDKVRQLNLAGAQCSRIGAGDNKWIAGSMGASGKMLIIEEVTQDQLYQAFKEQALALEEGGANVALIETFSDLEEAVIAVNAVKENTNLDIICSFTFEPNSKGEFRTMMGLSPETAVKSMVEAGVHVVGANCGNGIKNMVEILKEMRKADDHIPIIINSNAGLPVLKDGKTVYEEDPKHMAKYVPLLVQHGANIIGGCCGTSPEHIMEMKKALMLVEEEK